MSAVLPITTVPTLREALASYISNRTLAPSTVKRYSDYTRRYCSDLLDMPIDQITLESFEAKQKQLSPFNLRRVLTILNTLTRLSTTTIELAPSRALTDRREITLEQVFVDYLKTKSLSPTTVRNYRQRRITT